MFDRCHLYADDDDDDRILHTAVWAGGFTGALMGGVGVLFKNLD